MLVVPRYYHTDKDYTTPPHPQIAESSFEGLEKPKNLCEVEGCLSYKYGHYQVCVSCLRHRAVIAKEAMFLALDLGSLRDQVERWHYKHPGYRLERYYTGLQFTTSKKYRMGQYLYLAWYRIRPLPERRSSNGVVTVT